MKRLNDRVRAGSPMTSHEDAAWKRWMDLPPNKETRRKKKKRKRRKLRKLAGFLRGRSSSSRAARTWKSGASSTSPWFLTVPRPVSACGLRSTGFGFFWELCPKCFRAGCWLVRRRIPAPTSVHARSTFQLFLRDCGP